MKFFILVNLIGDKFGGHLMLREDNHYLSPEMLEGGGGVRRIFGRSHGFRRNAKETNSRQTSIKTKQK